MEEQDDGDFRRPEAPRFASTPRSTHTSQVAASTPTTPRSGARPREDAQHVHSDPGGGGDITDASTVYQDVSSPEVQMEGGRDSPDFEYEESENSYVGEGFKCLVCGEKFTEPEINWKTSEANARHLQTVYG